MTTKLRLAGLLLGSAFLFTSCASILNGKEQKVQVQTKSADSKVYLNNKLAGEGKTVEVKMPRDQQVQQIKIEREGYKDLYTTHYQTRKSPLYIMSWVPFGVLFYPPFMDNGPKSYNYKKELVIDQNDQRIIARTDNEKFIYVKNTGFDVEEEDFKIQKIKRRNFRKGKDKYQEVEVNDEKIEFDNSVFSNSLVDILEKYNYLDTTNTILKKRTNTLYVNASVKNISFSNIYEISARAYMIALKADVVIDWEITDIYGQPQFKKTIKGTSGEFAMKNENSDNITDCLDDAIASSFIEFTGQKEVRKLINKEEEKEIKFDYITLNKQVAPVNMEQAMNASVTVETDLGHGSGFAVSSDGYIVTNLHVIANAKEIHLITNTGEKIEAKVVRQNENKDLALLKADTAFDYAFSLSKDKNYGIGMDIYAIGTPNSIELGQTLSKGIISGVRQNEEENYIQTDASVNSGNSGGPLINNEGLLLGVVNAKLKGVGIEGIGFAIPVFEIEKSLFLN